MPAAAPVPRTARERARAEITAEILATARAHLASEGASALSLRAVARDLGMVSSALYRYFPNRDALLTALIVEAYDSLGASVEADEAAVARTDLLGRFLAICHAVRTWALAHPHEYALIYGSPVPGYAAPADTVAPASRVPTVLIGILVDLPSSGPAPGEDAVSPTLHAALRPVQETLGGAVSDSLLLRGMATWSALFGAVSLELFGHLHNVIDEDGRTAYFDHQMRSVAVGIGLTGG